MNTFKQQCLDLRAKGHTLAEIVEKTGRPKTSVYFHIQNIPLSDEKKEHIKKRRGDHIRRFAVERKGKSTRIFLTFNTWTPNLVCLVAHLMFDGEILRKRVVYSNRSIVLIDRVKTCMAELYEFPPHTQKNETTGVVRVSYFNVALGIYLHQKALDLLHTIPVLPIEHRREFLRAFFDDEGCMDYQPRHRLRRVRGYQKDKEILKLVSAILYTFNIESKVIKPNEVVIFGKHNLEKFQKEINFSRGVCINGNRPNSIWKKNIEKRQLLNWSIKSFQT